MDDRLKQWISPVATIAGSGDLNQDLTRNKDLPYKKEDEFIAIAEGIELPLYIFTYNIEMTQFAFTDMMRNPEQKEQIDKSLISRHHAQFISHQIADEGRLNGHKHDLDDEDFERLIKHHRIASVEYTNDVDHVGKAWKPMPQGLQKQDIYLVTHKVQAAR